MQNVSTLWRTNQLKNMVSEGFVEVTSIVADTAQATSVITDTNCETFGKTTWNGDREINNLTDYATLEGIWELDGQSILLKDDSKTYDIGYVSTMLSDENNVFTVEPTVSIKAVEDTHTIAGVTVTFTPVYEEYATDFDLKVYKNDILLDVIHVTGNDKVVCIVRKTITTYDRIDCVIKKWCCSGHRARVEKLLLGIELIYAKPEILSFSETKTADPITTELPSNVINYELRNETGDFDPDNESGVGKYLLENQEIATRYGFKVGNGVEWIDGGIYYLDEWSLPSNGITCKFKASDIISKQTDDYTGTYEGVTLGSMAEQCFAQSNIDKYFIDESLYSVYTPTDIDKFEYSIAETLQLIANAGACALEISRQNVVSLKKVKASLSNYRIDGFNSYKNGEYELSLPLSKVIVNKGLAEYTEGVKGETQEIENPLIATQEQGVIVAKWVYDFLCIQKSIKGDFRADPRLDPLDGIINSNKYNTFPLWVTSVTYKYNGAFRGSYKGRVYTQVLKPESRELNTFRLGVDI